MQLIEHTTWASQSIDEEAGVIKGVKILGLESQNGRTYKPDAVETAKKLYEGMGINLDHMKGNRRVSDGFGRLRSVELREDGLYGNLEYLKSHPYADQFVESAKRMPEQVGLSHSAEGKVAKQGDKEVVEEISAVHSVDVVRYPATTKGLFESTDPEPLKVVVVKDLSEGHDPADEETPPADPPADPPAEDPPVEDPPAEDPPAEDPPVEDPPAEDTPTVESLQQEMRELQHRLDISEALLAGNVDVSSMTEAQTTELRSKQTREEIQAFVESLPQMTRRTPQQPAEGASTYSQLREEFDRSRRSSRFRRAV
jgi:hypothetical protein